MLSEVDENYYPRFYMAEAMSIGENYDAAKMQALELAKQNLAGQIQTEVTSIIESTVANTQLEAEEAASVVETVSASKNVIAQSLGRVIVVTETYRVLSNKNREVLVRIAYNAEAAKKQAKVAIKQELQEKGNQLHQQLDNLLGF
jgi:SHS2 domain-containing protein